MPNDMMARTHGRPGLLGLFVVAAAALHCASNKVEEGSPAAPTLTCPASLGVQAEGAPWAPAPDVTMPIATTFTVTVDPQHPVLAGEWRQPHGEPLAFAGGTATLHLTGGVKRFAKHPERLFFELYLVSEDPLGFMPRSTAYRQARSSTTSPTIRSPLPAPRRRCWSVASARAA